MYPLRISKNTGTTHVDLMFLMNATKQYYCCIRSISRLLTSQVTHHKESVYFCQRCLGDFSRRNLLDTHMKYCIEKDPDRAVMPNKDTFKNLKNHNRKMRDSAVIYADFECYLNNIDTCQPNASKPYTNASKRHIPLGFYYRVVYTHKETKEGLVYCGEDIAKTFVKCMEEEMSDIIVCIKMKKIWS